MFHCRFNCQRKIQRNVTSSRSRVGRVPSRIESLPLPSLTNYFFGFRIMFHQRFFSSIQQYWYPHHQYSTFDSLSGAFLPILWLTYDQLSSPTMIISYHHPLRRHLRFHFRLDYSSNHLLVPTLAFSFQQYFSREGHSIGFGREIVFY